MPLSFQAHFCGQDDFCREFNNPHALQRARANIDLFYPVVLVLELIQESLCVMERKVPEYFRGARVVFNGMPGKAITLN